MNVVAAVFADFAETFLGTPSRLLERLAGVPVLQHTLRRVARIGEVSRRCLVVRPRDAAAAGAFLHDSGLAAPFELLPIDDQPRTRRRLIRAARKWNLAGWRGTPLGTTWFDEFVEPLLAARVIQHTAADAVLCIDGHQAALDWHLAGRMIAHAASHTEHARFVFTQAPPGLAGLLLRREQAVELAQGNAPVGMLLCYRPEVAQMDPINRDPCLQVDRVISQTHARFLPDAAAGSALLDAGLAELGEDVDALSLCRFARRRVEQDPPRLAELEIELTTDDPLPDCTVRPRGTRCPARGPATVDAIARVAAEFARWNDEARVIIAGHGDPLRHREFESAIRAVRAAGISALAVRTPLVELSDAQLEAMLEARVDVLEVPLDANSAATYQRVQGPDAFARVLANIERVDALRVARAHPEPILAPSLVRCGATLAELEAFYDGWLRRTGAALIRGYSSYGGRLPPDTLLGATPLLREGCQRLDARLVLLADGRAVACDQDMDGQLALGRWDRTSLRELWNGDELAGLRAAHRRGAWGDSVACRDCGEWFRQ